MTFIDSTGVQLLVEVVGEARVPPRLVRLTPPGEAIARVFAICGVGELLLPRRQARTQLGVRDAA